MNKRCTQRREKKENAQLVNVQFLQSTLRAGLFFFTAFGSVILGTQVDWLTPDGQSPSGYAHCFNPLLLLP